MRYRNDAAPPDPRRHRRQWPVVLPLGVLEYHGEHMAVGMDTLAVTRALDLLEKEAEIVILPPFAYGAASYAVEPPEGTGTRACRCRARSCPSREALFTGLLRDGFRNIHGFIHHQTENFAAGMPTDLAFRFGGPAGDLPLPREDARRGLVGQDRDARTTMPSRPAAMTRSTGSRSIR